MSPTSNARERVSNAIGVRPGRARGRTGSRGHHAWPVGDRALGALWEHLVLEHLQAHFPDTTIRYWRDKAGREVDFVLAHRRDEVDTIECKWDSRSFDSTALQLFRVYYPSPADNR